MATDRTDSDIVPENKVRGKIIYQIMRRLLELLSAAFCTIVVHCHITYEQFLQRLGKNNMHGNFK